MVAEVKIFKKLFYRMQFYWLYWTKQQGQCDAVDNFAGQLIIQPSIRIAHSEGVVFPKIIWLYWQGDMPTLVQHCIDQIKTLHPDYAVHVLDPQSVNKFIQFDLQSPVLQKATAQQHADLIRFDLLYHHGGIWLDASIMLYEKLDWIVQLMHETQTQSFAYYRKKNTTLPEFPVIENWLLATLPQQAFFKRWFEELFAAIEGGVAQYIQAIRANYPNYDDYFQRIGRLEYLVAYVACQKVMRDDMPSMVLLNCDQNAFYYQVKNQWVKERTLIDFAIHKAPNELPKLIKLAGKERHILDQHYAKKQYFSGTLLDF